MKEDNIIHLIGKVGEENGSEFYLVLRSSNNILCDYKINFEYSVNGESCGLNYKILGKIDRECSSTNTVSILCWPPIYRIQEEDEKMYYCGENLPIIPDIVEIKENEEKLLKKLKQKIKTRSLSLPAEAVKLINFIEESQSIGMKSQLSMLFLLFLFEIERDLFSISQWSREEPSKLGAGKLNEYIKKTSLLSRLVQGDHVIDSVFIGDIISLIKRYSPDSKISFKLPEELSISTEDLDHFLFVFNYKPTPPFSSVFILLNNEENFMNVYIPVVSEDRKAVNNLTLVVPSEQELTNILKTLSKLGIRNEVLYQNSSIDYAGGIVIVLKIDSGITFNPPPGRSYKTLYAKLLYLENLDLLEIPKPEKVLLAIAKKYLSQIPRLREEIEFIAATKGGEFERMFGSIRCNIKGRLTNLACVKGINILRRESDTIEKETYTNSLNYEKASIKTIKDYLLLIDRYFSISDLIYRFLVFFCEVDQ